MIFYPLERSKVLFTNLGPWRGSGTKAEWNAINSFPLSVHNDSSRRSDVLLDRVQSDIDLEKILERNIFAQSCSEGVSLQESICFQARMWSEFV